MTDSYLFHTEQVILLARQLNSRNAITVAKEQVREAITYLQEYLEA